ncbi:Uncharacterised protein [uncultured archaeon]|nr:Uncharacterised protein [uncultured archaeon]
MTQKMGAIEYHVKCKMGWTKSEISFLSNDGIETGKLFVHTNLNENLWWSSTYEENGSQLFTLNLISSNNFRIEGIADNTRFTVKYDPFTRKAKIIDNEGNLLYRAKPGKRPITDLPLMQNAYKPPLRQPWNLNLLGGAIAITGLVRLFYGSPGWVQVTDLSDQVVLSIKHEGRRKAGAIIDDSNIDRRLGFALLAIYSYL